MIVRQRIETRPDVMLGKPVVQGIPVTFELVLRELAEGSTPDRLFDAECRLTSQHHDPVS